MDISVWIYPIYQCIRFSFDSHPYAATDVYILVIVWKGMYDLLIVAF